MAQANILHADLDAFYASVEQLLDPALRGRPVAVGGGVVLASSYEAKAYGVQSGMSVSAARLLCPALVSVDGHFDRYRELGDAVFTICEDFTPKVERISIDEAFLDVRGATHLFGDATTIATAIRSRVRTEVGLPLSIGVARTKFLAKVASQVAKPDGLVVVPPDAEMDFLHPLDVGLMWGVGTVRRRRLAERGISTIGDLAQARPGTVERLVGTAMAEQFAALSWNDDARSVQRERSAGSVGAQSAMPRAAPSRRRIHESLHALADRVGARLRKSDRAGRTVTVRLRVGDRRMVSRRRTLGSAICSSDALYRVAVELADQLITEEQPGEVSLVGIAVSKLRAGAVVQLELPYGDGLGSERARERAELDRAVDAARSRFGKDLVQRATDLGRRQGVPDTFRELAERS